MKPTNNSLIKKSEIILNTFKPTQNDPELAKLYLAAAMAENNPEFHLHSQHGDKFLSQSYSHASGNNSNSNSSIHSNNNNSSKLEPCFKINKNISDKDLC